MHKQLSVFAVVAAIALSVAPGWAQQSDFKWPSFPTDTKGNVVNALVMDPALALRARDFGTLRQIPSVQNPVLVPWLIEKANELAPAFLYETARRLWEMGRRDDAFEWFALAHIRASYDAARCVDRTAAQGIAALPPIAANVQKGMEESPREFSSAALRVIVRMDVFSSTVSPWWICSHGIDAFRAGLEKKSIDESGWLKPQSEWEKLRRDVKFRLTASFIAQGMSQDEPVPLSKTAYKITTVGKGLYHNFSWLDGERLVFGEPVRGSKPFTILLRQWRNGSAAPEEFARSFGAWCAGSGKVVYGEKIEREPGRPAARITFAVGEPGKTESVVIESASGGFRHAKILHDGSRMNYSISDPTRQSHFDCRWVTSEKLSGSNKNVEWVPLLPNHGFVAFAAPDGQPAQKLLYYSAEAAAPIELPISAKNILPDSIRYFAFKGAYFISPAEPRLSEADKKPSCAPVWWFFPQGARTEEICVPVDAVNANDLTYAPSRIGILRAVKFRSTAHGRKPGGIYLQSRDGRPEKIFEDMLEAISVSPDGCKVAVKHGEWNPVEKTLSVIDLCAAERAPSASTAR